ncbi:type I DNA topoisomerase [Geobacter sulfurreducens]|jgi:DNA topoisomerase-1|uniref:DNA topoisomerase 1 n=1 Tax=Geobacter sulfurreducens (strain ATCC 51573 / DSM 12127 / PCA) TaxID=243231 RepID=Q74A42_GEOSL|nr:type I DNA topoisomerase [Geobacter sulfurreducens]AAR35922.1 DNA topoisomerase I [Geobacter sulfurreducens PCA]ADI85307.1 DNA topoisomerase I [Geobacter sulfurreducens KN400]AJY68838.1 DNA topoisomerase I [Geobacter sulfurreducens]UAC03245.1 type I DNA topoisomerase [Geobacter sulfurreducens]UTG91899.1 type I DNA topoisomerase [Geobacter sulfurreducens]
MSQHLVIVESPAKAKTIEKFLGPDYKVLASYGHVRALPSKQGSVDVEHDFEPRYAVLPESKRHIDAIKKELKASDSLLLATDPDREGEAISWHLLAALGVKPEKPPVPVRRVVFHEITKDAIVHAVENPRDISQDLVDAQQARSILDYLVGFNLSPFLWKKIRYGLSAGRVQSVALRLICEREKEIQAFQSQEYWTIGAELAKEGGQKCTANLVEAEGKKLDKFDIPDQAAADRLVKALENATFTVDKVTKSERKRTPAPPFTTSTLQQEAARKLGFSAKKTMATAQKLYEGVAIDEGLVGLITYMRTDSVVLSNQALQEAHQVITSLYGPEYALAKPRFYKNKAKNAQEAHEAVRPTSIARTPAELKKYLSSDQFKLYDLIWKRTVACQMAEALLDQTSVDIGAGKGYRFRAAGTVIRFPGFMKLYIEGVDDQAEEKEGTLPPLTEGELLKLLKLLPEQHFTQPPPRYTEASLVKTLEEYGIGRPSTYASIMNTLLERKYARLDSKRFIPEDVGMVVNDLLTNHFTTYVDYNFTATLEEELDQVSRGEKRWKPLLREFWEPFQGLLKQKEGEVSKADLTTEATDEACPECGKPLVVKLGKRGKFIACSGYKEGCTYTRNIDQGEGREQAEPVLSEEKCDKCGSPMLIKDGRFGKYLACSAYPACKNIQPLVKPKGTGHTCPECKEGELTEKKSRYGKMFYSCNRYPQCKFALWDPPQPGPCPKCGFPLLVKKVYKREGEFLKCPKEGCDYRTEGKK